MDKEPDQTVAELPVADKIEPTNLDQKQKGFRDFLSRHIHSRKQRAVTALVALVLIAILAFGFIKMRQSTDKAIGDAASGSDSTAFYGTDAPDLLEEEPESEDAPAETLECKDGGTAMQADWTGKAETVKLSFLKPPKPEEIDADKPGKVDVNKYVSYARIGTTSDGKPIILFRKFVGFINEQTGLALQDSDNSFTILLRHSSIYLSGEDKPDLPVNKGVSFDKEKQFPELCIRELDYKGLKLTSEYFGGAVDAPEGKRTLVQSYEVGDLYEISLKEESSYHMLYYALQRKDTLWQDLYTPYPFATTKDDSSYPDITWNDGKKNDDYYTTVFRGCGSPGAFEVIKNLTSSDVEQIGKDKNGTAVYGFKSVDQPLFKLYYETYKDFYTKDNLGESYKKAFGDLSITAYKNLHPVLIHKDALGRYISIVRGTFYPGGGCGKPVVYLYPEAPTKVSVKVGADVVISDPTYPLGGWQQVLAQPNGQLTYQGKQYPNLYWEGYGHGEYPRITAGTIVPRVQVVKTIEKQLRQQGLNAQEIRDFMDFWVAELPTTPYTRLTWFSRAAIDRLAPLTVSPRPVTVIRVFLDFEGLQQPIDLPPQHFTRPARQGFTVVEWGGLLENFKPVR